MTDAEFCEWARHILLGDDWYVVMPMGNDQINEEALEEIIFQKCGMDAKDRMKNRLNKEHLVGAFLFFIKNYCIIL
jgi:hypothetical protein